MPYLIIDYGIALVIGVIQLFLEDIKRWNRQRALRRRDREMRAKGYENVDGGAPKSKWADLRNVGKVSSLVMVTTFLWRWPTSVTQCTRGVPFSSTFRVMDSVPLLVGILSELTWILFVLSRGFSFTRLTCFFR